MINKAPTIHSYFSGVAFTAFLVAWPRRTPINKPFLVYRSLCVSPIPTSAGSAGQIIGKSWLVVAERTISEPRIDAPVARLRSSLDPFLRGSIVAEQALSNEERRHLGSFRRGTFSGSSAVTWLTSADDEWAWSVGRRVFDLNRDGKNGILISVAINYWPGTSLVSW